MLSLSRLSSFYENPILSPFDLFSLIFVSHHAAPLAQNSKRMEGKASEDIRLNVVQENRGNKGFYNYYSKLL